MSEFHPRQPLDEDWEKAAIKDLVDIMQWLCHGSFANADDFCERMAGSTRAIKSVWGRGEPTARERLAEWRGRLEEFEQSQSSPPRNIVELRAEEQK